MLGLAISFVKYFFSETLHDNLPVVRAKQLGRSMKKTASCKKATELPGQSSSLIGQKKYFSAQSAGRNSTTSGTGSVRISSQGLFSSLSKLSPENIASSRLVAPGFPRMCEHELTGDVIIIVK